MTIITIPKEPAGENRVAMTPKLMPRLSKLGLIPKLQSTAGAGIFASDALYQELNPELEILATKAEVFSTGNIVITLTPPTLEEIGYLQANTILITQLYPHKNSALVKKLQTQNITSFAMELIPRISRAQDMDVLSSQATIAGYKAVLLAADNCNFFFPMLATAAGSIKPAKVLIIGAGVAGLQAIATAKRLGAMVAAYDVREETREQVASLGAKFIETSIKAAGTGGYARKLTPAEHTAQKQLLAQHLAASDVVITTAGIPGTTAPCIISQDMVANMHPGAIIVDIMGGNCELTQVNATINYHDVTIMGPVNLPSMLAINASEMYAKNLSNFLNLIVQDGVINLNWHDEIIAGCAVTHAGNLLLENLT